MFEEVHRYCSLVINFKQYSYLHCLYQHTYIVLSHLFDEDKKCVIMFSYLAFSRSFLLRVLHCYLLPQEWQRLKLLVRDLLSALYQRDCRRAFCKAEHWVAPSLRHSILVSPEEFSAQEGEREGERVEGRETVRYGGALSILCPYTGVSSH